MAIKSHHIRSKLITLLAVMVILFAVLFSVFRMLVPYITDYGDDIEAEISRQLKLPVEIVSVDADIVWLLPRLKLLDVNFYDPDNYKLFLHLDEINLSIDWFKSLTTFKPELGAISLVGLDLKIQRDAAGDFFVQGYNVSASANNNDKASVPEEFNALLDNSSVYIIDSRLHWSDQINNNQQLIFKDFNLALINDQPGHQLAITLKLPDAYGKQLELTLNIEGPLNAPSLWKGQAFMSAKNIILEEWFDDYWQYFDFTGAGQLDASIWLDWQNLQLTELNAELNASNLGLHYLDGNVRSWGLDELTGKLKWKRYAEGWRLDVRQLDVVRDLVPWSVSSSIGLKMNTLTNVINLNSNYLRIEDLSYMAELATRFLPKDEMDLASLLSDYTFKGDIYDLDVYAPLEKLSDIKVSAVYEDLSFDSSNAVASFAGLDGQLNYQSHEILLMLDSQDVLLDFDGLFRDKLLVSTINGDVKINNDVSGWLLQSDMLSVNTPYLDSSVRFKISLPTDEAAYMDLVANFNNGIGAYKSLYLPTKIMPEGAVNWLDDALVTLDIPSGGVIYHGTFNDFPFLKKEGVFEVLFDVENATLKYLEDWPELRNMQAQVKFYNEGMHIKRASGNLFNARFDNTEIIIPDFDETHVMVDGDLQGKLFDVLNFLDQSPLKKVVGAYVSELGVEGEAHLKLNLQIPVSKGGDTQVSGDLDFLNNSVYLPKENYHFKDVNGRLKFTENGVKTEKLRASIDGYPFDLSILTIEKDHVPVTHVSANGRLQVKSLLSPVAFIKPYLEGESDWDIDIYVATPENELESKVDVFISSDLSGVSSSLIGPFAKKADAVEPFKLHLTVLADELKTYIKYSNNSKLSADLKNEVWTTNIDTSAIKGRASFSSNFALDRVANIKLEYLNASEFIQKKSKSNTKSNIQPRYFPPINFQADQIDWQNKTFTEVKVATHRIKTGMKINSIELNVPGISARGSAVWGRNWLFENVTQLEFDLSINDLGLGLSSLGLAENIKNTEGKVKSKWKWDAGPFDFDWKKVTGDSFIDLEDGSLTDIEVGAGRLLGVLNFKTIFSLDFRKQIKKGFSFDDIKANFSFVDGHAHTNNFEIESKVADIEMQGRVGLVDKDYDLQVKVLPKISNSFTAIGVATGGPVLGLGVHLFQKLFGVDKVASSKSSITGSWQAPVITATDKPLNTISAEQNDLDENF